MAVRNVEAELARLTPLRDAPPAEALPALGKALGDRINLVVAKAAKIAAERRMRDLIPDLLHALDRLFEKPAERDPQCWGKNALAQALVDLDHREAAPFLRGIRHIQMEAVWGGQEDTASTLRGICVLALVACTDIAPEKTLRCLVDALADRAATVRVEAARALAQMDGSLLLRLKARLGDREANVTGQVFDSLLHVEREEALEFVAEFLKSEDEAIREEAALALGASRMPGAVALLREAWDAAKDEILLRGISASRQDEAIAFLLDLVRNGRIRDAAAALEALAIHKDSEEIRKQARAAAESRGIAPSTPPY
jgi:HEAT repeat protein